MKQIRLRGYIFVLLSVVAIFWLGSPVLALRPERGTEKLSRLDLPATVGEIKAAAPELKDVPDNIVQFYMLEWPGLILMDKLPYQPTPHAEWLPPELGKKLRVLIVTSTHSLRQVAEFAQRTNADVRLLCLIDGVDFTAVDEEAAKSFGGGSIKPFALLTERRTKELLSDPLDVIVTTCTPYPNRRLDCGRKVRQLLADAVKKGAGLVFLGGDAHHVLSDKMGGSDDPLGALLPVHINAGQGFGTFNVDANTVEIEEHYITKGLSVKDFPWSTALQVDLMKPEAQVIAQAPQGPLFVLGQAGDGRVFLSTRYNGFCMLGPGCEDRRLLDDYYCFITKALLWAAKREPKLQISLTTVQPKVAWGQPLKFSLQLRNTTAVARGCVIKAHLRNSQGEQVTTKAINSRVPANEDVKVVLVFTFAQPLTAGKYHCDVQVLDTSDGGVDIATTPLTVESPVELVLAVDKEIISEGDTVKVNVQLRGVDKLSQPALRLQLWDSLDRLVAAFKLPVSKSAGEISLTQTFALHHLLGRTFEVRALLLDGKKPVVSATAELSQPLNRWPDDFVQVLWGHDWTDAELELRTVNAMGFTHVLRHANDAPKLAELARANLGGVLTGIAPLITRYFPKREDDDQHHPPALSEEVDQQTQAIAKNAAPFLKRHGVLGLSIADEPMCTYEASFDELTIGAFRNYLQEEYKTLRALNAAWETNFSSWEELKPFKAAQVTDRANLAPWLEFRMFMDTIMAKRCQDAANIWRQAGGFHYPVGLEGLFGFQPHIIPFGCLDWGKLAASDLGLWGPYGTMHIQSEPYGHCAMWLLMRSITKGQKLCLSWVGYGRDEWFYHAHPWDIALHGADGTAWFFAPTFMPTGDALSPRGEWVREATKELREGVGKLLLLSKHHSEPIAILYSHHSHYIDYILQERLKFALLHPAMHGRYAFERLLLDLQAQFEYLTPQMIDQGALEGFKLLIIPHVIAMSQKTAQAIVNFVKKGGVVLADFAVAVYDEKGKALTKGYLDDLFGIEREKLVLRASPPHWDVGITHPVPEFPLTGIWLAPEIFEEGIKVTTAKALGEVVRVSNAPAFVFNKTDNGYTLLLNFMLANYIRTNEAPYRELLSAVLKLAKIEPKVKVTDGNSLLPHYCVNQFDNDPMMLIGIQRHRFFGANLPPTVTVQLPANYHIYNVLERKYSGFSDNVKVALAPGETALICILPYELTAINLIVPKRCQVGDEVKVKVKLQGKVKRWAKHILRLEAIAPDGTIAAGYTGNIEADGGFWEGVIPFALNDPLGVWTVRIRDVATGSQAERKLRLQPRRVKNYG